MSIDPSLKIKGALERHRNVLSRPERIERLKDEEQWVEGDPVLALPKVANRKSHSGRKEKAAAAAAKVAEAETPEAEAEAETKEVS